MSTGRHARKRAAQAEERLAKEQEALLGKEEAKKKEMQRDVESQRIATMRVRFGGQAPEAVADNAAQTTTPDAQRNLAKFKSPTRLSTSDPMRRTIMGMMLNDDDFNQQGRRQ